MKTEETLTGFNGAPSVYASEGHAYTEDRMRYWDERADTLDRKQAFRRYYQQRLAEIYRNLVPPGMRVLEIGSGSGDLLAALRPAEGLGVDFSAKMVDRARLKYPSLQFQRADALTFAGEGQGYDHVICSDLVNDLWDVEQFFHGVRRCCHPDSRFILNSYSRLWELPRRFAEWAGFVQRQRAQNWLAPDDLVNLLYLADFEVIRRTQEIGCPIPLPILSRFANRYLVKLWPFRFLALTNVLVARPRPVALEKDVSVTVVVAARNEAGNIEEIFARVPELGLGTELIFVEGHSKDETYTTIERHIARNPGRRVKLFKQPGRGKGDAVREGFRNATGDLLMILDADLTVRPEDLPRFYEAWKSGKAEFVNGVRLVYPMQDGAMRFLNSIGNKFFSFAFSWLLGQSIKDTLCGTKVLSRRDYETIAANRAYFGEIDPFGDFDLIFGAARYSRKIVDLPVRYGERTYGVTNIQRWSHGLLLLRMVAKAMRKIKFL